jgi:hypothetical protein
MIAQMLDQLCMWVDDAQLRNARKNAPGTLLEDSAGAIRNYIQSTNVPKLRELILDRVEALAKQTGLIVDTQALKLLRTRLVNDPEFARLVR